MIFNAFSFEKIVQVKGGNKLMKVSVLKENQWKERLGKEENMKGNFHKKDGGGSKRRMRSDEVSLLATC